MSERLSAPWLADLEVARVMEALAAGGRPARFVGGSVRDALLDPAADTMDLDIASPERPERVMKLVAAVGFRPLPTGLRHGTVSIVRQQRRFEITTLRRDVATDGRHAVVEFTDDFAADAARRDFTINAMSCEADGTLHDPMGGRADLAAGRVRFVGDPARRIAEDYLRILRFFRFHARFGLEEPDAAALAACTAAAAGIDGLSGERVRQELWLILAQAEPLRALEPMAATSVLAHVVPGPLHLERLRPDGLGSDPLLRLAVLVRPSTSHRAEALAERLRLSNQEQERLSALMTTALPGGDDRAQRVALHRLGSDRYRDLVRLDVAAGELTPEEGRHRLGLADQWQAPAFPLSGADLLALGIPEGRALGQILARVRLAWEESDFSLDRAECLALSRDLTL
ncbi:MAG: CCA tRNA nucleotidyltransferase [Geminicoccaceae bacterium]